MRWFSLVAVVVLALVDGGVGAAQKGRAKTAAEDTVTNPVSVPLDPPPGAKSQSFNDRKSGVRFDVPPGWSLSRHDREVSTFALDARSASARSSLRGVASIEFNPYPLSNFSGALFYFSVQKHVHADDCAREAYTFGKASPRVETVGGSEFAHGHDEHGGSCVEAHDEVYTAYRKGSCFRFDLEINTFCTQANGAFEMSAPETADIERRMNAILGSVELRWKGKMPPDAPAGLPQPSDRRLLTPPEEPRPGIKSGSVT